MVIFIFLFLYFFAMSGVSNKQKFILGTFGIVALIFIFLIIGFIIINSFSSLFQEKCVAEVDIEYPLTVDGMPATLMSEGYPSSEEIATKIRELNTRDDVAAVLFVFNSEGGSTVATKEVYDSMKDLKKPKVAYFREVAASGAYYAATSADYIVAEPYALTGSIGVIATVVSMSGLFEKIGINATSVTSGKHKDIGSPFREMSEEEQSIMKAIVDEVFQDFKKVVIENRKGKINMARADEIFDGRIVTGKQAKELGLVDAIGGKRDAIIKAAELGGIKNKKPEDIRICKIEARTESNPLFGATSFIHGLSEKLPSTGIYFK